MPRSVRYLLLVLALGLCGCDDDTTGPDDDAFSVTINVADGQGHAVAGIRVASMPVVPDSFWLPPVGGVTYPTSNVVTYTLGTSTSVRLEVRDVAGTVVRLLVDGVQAPGVHSALWDGRDDAGQPRSGGWYAFHLEHDGQIADIPCILAVCDPEWHSLGTTDAGGRLIVRDRAMVPAFWTPAPVGEVALTTATRLRLEDATGAGMYVTFSASDGPQTVDVIWVPEPVAFAIDLTILQADGETPVAGARIGGMPAVPAWAWSEAAPLRPALEIPFILAQSSVVILTVQDVTGETVRTLVDAELPAGMHVVRWDGRDDDLASTPPGWYKVRFTATAEGVPAVADSAGIIQATFEPGQYTWGETDAAGRVRLADRRLIPGLWDLPPVVATNELGEVLGTFDLTTRTWLSVEGAGWVVLDDLTDGWQAVTATVRDWPLDKAAGAIDLGGDDPPPLSTRLNPPYPNPFN